MRYYPRTLTEQHWEIIGLVAEGLGNADIGKRLHLTEDTVKTHLRGIFKLLGASSRAQLVHLAYQRGILVVDPLPMPLPEPGFRPAPVVRQPKARLASQAPGPLFERRGLIHYAVTR